MADFSGIINTQLLLLGLIGIGVITAKTGVVDSHSRGVLSNLVLYLLLPGKIVSSFIGSRKDLLFSLVMVLIVSTAVMLTACALGQYVFFRRSPRDQKKVLCYSTLCSSATFLGNPVVEGLYGSLGLIYASVFLFPIRIFTWTAGLRIFTGTGGSVKKALVHPCLIATYTGLVLMFSGWIPPVFIRDLALSLGNCTTPFSMLVVGHTLGRTGLQKLVTKTVLYYTLIRLALIPLALWGILLAFKTDPVVTGVTVTLTGMPAPTTAAILAAAYGGDAELASKIILTSVLFSMLTIPGLIFLIRQVS
jgi:predicted permease